MHKQEEPSEKGSDKIKRKVDGKVSDNIVKNQIL